MSDVFSQNITPLSVIYIYIYLYNDPDMPPYETPLKARDLIMVSF